MNQVVTAAGERHKLDHDHAAMSNSDKNANSRRPLAQRRHAGRGLVMVEEAYCLLRAAPLSTLAVFYVGAVPFVAALFYFWADMSRSSFAIRDAAWSALGVAMTYIWMKTAQAWFCRSLWAQVNSEGDLPKLERRQWIENLVAHALIQSLALPLLTLSAVFMLPLAWAYAFFHNATVLALTRAPEKQPLRHLVSASASLSHWRWAANHVTMAITSLAAFLVWANLIMFAVLAPQLLKWLFGVESVFTLFPLASLSNTTFLFATLLGTFLVMGPLTQSIYVLRCFYGDSRRSGVDLLSRLATIRAHRTVTVIGFVVMLVATIDVHGQDSPADNVAEFDQAIHQTLQGKPYQWRLSRNYDVAGLADQTDQEKGLTAMIRRSFERFAESLKRLFATLFEPGRGQDRGGEFNNAGNRSGKLAAVVSILSLVFIVALVVWAVVQIRRRSLRAVVKAAAGAPTRVDGNSVDLEKDDLIASQLPEDEWLRLAREQIGAGKFRLAVRALFLGSLAHLGERRLIAVARHKSNLDYRNELDLKARSLPDLREAFAENVRQFESAWYGDHRIDEATAIHFAENCQRIAAQRESNAVAFAAAKPLTGEVARA